MLWWLVMFCTLSVSNVSFPVFLTSVQQDPDSETGSTENEVSEVRNNWNNYVICFSLIPHVLFSCCSCAEVTWEQTSQWTCCFISCTTEEQHYGLLHTHTHTPLMDSWDGKCQCDTYPVLVFEPQWCLQPSTSRKATLSDYDSSCRATDNRTSLLCTFLGVAVCFCHIMGVTSTMFKCLYTNRWERNIWHFIASVCATNIISVSVFVLGKCTNITCLDVLLKWFFECLHMWLNKTGTVTSVHFIFSNSSRQLFFFFIVLDYVQKYKKHAKNRLFILVHIYSVTCAFHRDVPCFISETWHRRVNTFRYAQDNKTETDSRHIRTDTRQQ